MKLNPVISPNDPAVQHDDDSSTLSSFHKHKHRKRFELNETYTLWEEKLTIQSFNMDLHNLATEDPQRAKDALEIMDDMFQQGMPSTVEPNAPCYNTVIDAFIQDGDMATAQDLLNRMEDLADTESRTAAAPSEYTYMLVAQGWAEDAIKEDVSGKSADQAEQVMRRMQARGMPPNVKVWSIVLDGWCKRAGVARIAMQRAEELLREMETQHPTTFVSSHQHDNKDKQQHSRSSTQSTKTTNVASRNSASEDDASALEAQPTAPPPNIITYTSYIAGLARSKDWSLARKADATLVRMEQAGIQPDVVAYTSVINCWSKAKNRKERELASSRALRILEEMERRYAKGNHQAKPSLITYATAIRAIGNSLDSDSPERAEGVLRRLYEFHESGKMPSLKPTTAIYNAVINAISRSPRRRVFYAKRAEQYLKEMHERYANGEEDVQPDVRTWAAVLRSWSMSGAKDAAENAQRVLDKLEQMYKQGETPVRPNYVCYTTVMGAWGNSRRFDALEKLEGILRKMEDHFTKTQEADMRPNTVSYVSAIDAFVRRNDRNAAKRAQATVDRMMKLYSMGLGHVRPTRIVFNTLIHAWSKSKEPDAAVRAEEIFKWMEAQYQAGDYLVRPDEVSLCAVLNAWANQAENLGAERAQQIFEHMQSLTLEERGFHISIMMPNIVIKAIARSKDLDAVAKAERILIRLENDYLFGRSNLRPDVTTYSSVINCCAYFRHPEGKGEALEVALRTFRKLCDLDGEGPNNITYGTLFKAIANLMPRDDEQRDVLVRSLFDKCSDEGLVDSFVLSVSQPWPFHLEDSTVILNTMLSSLYFCFSKSALPAQSYSRSSSKRLVPRVSLTTNVLRQFWTTFQLNGAPMSLVKQISDDKS